MTDIELNEALAKWAGKGGQALYPDYCHSLDAVATLEATAPNGYWDALASDTGAFVFSTLWQIAQRLAGATARQRAETMARTVGVWKAP